jgi:hypothetical protein
MKNPYSYPSHNSLGWDPDIVPKFTKAELSRILDRTDASLKRNPELRYGQAFWNSMYIECPKRSAHLRGSALDPFYNDGIVITLLHLMRADHD